MFKSALAAAAAASLLALLAGCETNPFAKADPPQPVAVLAPAFPMNGLLTTPGGMTLYTFDKDTANSGASACTGPCAALWPPFAAAADAAPIGSFTIVKRDDGTPQWAYKGLPLYTYSKDTRNGQTSGDNFKNLWHVIKP